jgi:hypothetical protein
MISFTFDCFLHYLIVSLNPNSPCTFFLSASTHDQDVFCFSPDERPCNGFEEALDRYRELVPHLRLAGNFYAFCSSIHLDCSYVPSSVNTNSYQDQHHLHQLLRWL